MFHAGTSLAMNWEGHDDWMADMPAALQYDDAHPAARPDRTLKVCAANLDNPYEQVPLRDRNCLEKGQKPKPDLKTRD